MGTNPSFGLSYGVLGPLEVRAGDALIPISAGKLRVVLATLLVSANRLVPATELIERLWGQNPPATARATLATYVMRLRRELTAGRLAAGREPIQTRPEGYLLEADDDSLDLLQFTHLLTEARRLAEQPPTELALLHEALALWRGPALVDVRSSSVLEGVALSLEESRISALERRIRLQIRLGGHVEVIGDLRALAAEHPLHERVHAQLMVALYLAGRRADALAAFRVLREACVTDLGVEPSHDLQMLQRSILESDEDSSRRWEAWIA